MSLPKLKHTRYLRSFRLDNELQLLYQYARANPHKAGELAEHLALTVAAVSALIPKEVKK